MWSLWVGMALAASPAGAGAAVGGVTLGTAAAGGLVGSAAGLGIGAAGCRQSSGPECWGPLLGASLGFAVGAGAGQVGGSYLGARAVRQRPRPIVLSATGALGVGVATLVVGGWTSSTPVTDGGLLICAFGPPLAAGLSAGVQARGAVVPTPNGLAWIGRF